MGGRAPGHSLPGPGGEFLQDRNRNVTSPSRKRNRGSPFCHKIPSFECYILARLILGTGDFNTGPAKGQTDGTGSKERPRVDRPANLSGALGATMAIAR